jgi:hypothetical protein
MTPGAIYPIRQNRWAAGSLKTRKALAASAQAGGTQLQCPGLTQIQVVDEEVEVGLLRVRRVRPARRVVAADLLEHHALAVAGDEPARAPSR